jgi:hypothetical protein
MTGTTEKTQKQGGRGDIDQSTYFFIQVAPQLSSRG